MGKNTINTFKTSLLVGYFILNSAKTKKKHYVGLRQKKQKLLSQKNHWTDTIASAMLHKIKSFVLKTGCRGARPTALVNSVY